MAVDEKVVSYAEAVVNAAVATQVVAGTASQTIKLIGYRVTPVNLSDMPVNVTFQDDNVSPQNLVPLQALTVDGPLECNPGAISNGVIGETQTGDDLDILPSAAVAIHVEVWYIDD